MVRFIHRILHRILHRIKTMLPPNLRWNSLLVVMSFSTTFIAVVAVLMITFAQ